MRNKYDVNPTPTGRTHGAWTEYTEAPLNHYAGYFWLRADGLRLGYRKAERYYKKGTKPVFPVREVLYAVTGPMGYDGAMAVPLENIIESSKLEYLPAHVRFMREGEEVERLESLGGVNIDRLVEHDAAKIFAYADEKWSSDNTKK